MGEAGHGGLGGYGSSPSLLSNQTKVKKTTKLKTLEPKSGVYTKYKSYLKKDSRFLKAFTKVYVFVDVKKCESTCELMK